jgi:hypothetical protein
MGAVRRLARIACALGNHRSNNGHALTNRGIALVKSNRFSFAVALAESQHECLSVKSRRVFVGGDTIAASRRNTSRHANPTG